MSMSSASLSSNTHVDHKCHVYTNKDRICFDLVVKLPLTSSRSTDLSVCRRLRFERSADESVSTFIDRLVASLNSLVESKFAAASKRKLLDAACQPFRLASAHFQLNAIQLDSNLTMGRLFQPMCSNSSSFVDRSLSNAQLIFVGEKPQTDITWQSSMDLVFNSARVIKCRLDLLPIVGCPILPLLDVCSNFSFEKSSFDWHIEQNDKWSKVPEHSGLIYTPTKSTIGRRLQLRITPRDSNGRLGLPLSTSSSILSPFYGDPVMSKHSIVERPCQSFLAQRLSALPPRNNSSSTSVVKTTLRLVSYNILADMYASSSLARTRLYPHCPPNCLTAAYRLPLLMRELAQYQADLIALQEVDSYAFQRYLQPFLSRQGLEGLLVKKRLTTLDGDEQPVVDLTKEKEEGCTLFYNPRRLRLVDTAHIDSILDQHRVDSEVGEAFADLPSKWPPPHRTRTAIDEEETVNELDEFLIHQTKAFSQCLLACVFQLLPQSDGENPPHYLVVANTHFFYHPDAEAFRYVQSLAVRNHLARLATKWQSRSDLPVSVLLAGDFNQRPESLGSQLLTNPNHVQLSFQSAYASCPPQFTNWVPGFRASIDAILCNRSGQLEPLYASPLPANREELASHSPSDQSLLESLVVVDREPFLSDPVELHALPNSQFPSDHLPLIVDFALKPIE